MKLYDGIDLHSNNCVMVLLDEEDRVVYEKRLPNDLGYTLHGQRLNFFEGLKVEC